jgi:hypothetical protein
MSPWITLRAAVFILLMVLLMTTIATGADDTPTFQKGVPTYQKGTVTKMPGVHISYELKGPDAHKIISNCGDFQTGQEVDYRVEQDKVYIRRDNGKEYKCSIEGTIVTSSAPDNAPLTYQVGTITGWSTQYYPGTVAFGGAPSATTKHKFYEVKGAGTIYEINDCGDFKIGQVVGYRLDDADENDPRIYIHRDNGKEYNCAMEGARTVEGAGIATPSAVVPSDPASSTAAAPAKP